ACSSAPTSRATRCSRSSRASPTSCGTDAAGCRPSASTGATARSRPSSPTSSRAEVRVAVRAEPAPAVHARGAITSWLSTVDHKRIGILYILTAIVFFVAGGIMALLMRAQLATPNEHFLTRSSYNQVMTMHGTTMIFLVVVPILAGFGNFLVPLHNMRTPGMSWMRMPLFIWAMETYALLLLLALPALSAGLTLLLLDRQVGTHFFLPDAGGNAILYQHVFWFFGHPEVYIMVLPAMGMVSEILPV